MGAKSVGVFQCQVFLFVRINFIVYPCQINALKAVSAYLIEATKSFLSAPVFGCHCGNPEQSGTLLAWQQPLAGKSWEAKCQASLGLSIA